MSRIVVFDLQNMSVGEFTAICDRGWMVNGTDAVSGGGETLIRVGRDVMETGWLRPGRLVLVQHEKLPAWAGVVDTPFGLAAPADVTLYNAEYLLMLRTPDDPLMIKGNVNKIVREMVAGANAQEEMYLRMGRMDGDRTYREETLDGRSYWDQLEALLLRSGTEMMLRAERNTTDGNRLYLYMDLAERLGMDSGFLLRDGADGNMQITGAVLEREIWNRVTAINGGQSEEERLKTQAFRDEGSIEAMRLRSRVVQFQDTVLMSTLEAQGRAFLGEYAMPVIRLEARILDDGDTFRHLRLGNGFLIHAADVVMPDGRRGWTGQARLMAMAYNEQENTVGAVLEARYELQR